jgi:hypothetical protein
MDVIVNENNGTVTVCLMKNVTTDGPIRVVFGAEEESGASNAASGAYYAQCLSISIIDLPFFGQFMLVY